MNSLFGKITQLKTSGNMTLVDVQVSDVQLRAVTIGAPEKILYLRIGHNIELLFNESEVFIGKEVTGSVSLSNQLVCRVNGWQEGDIFTCVELSFNGNPIHSLIVTSSFKAMDLHSGDAVTAYIKINEIFLKETEEVGIEYDKNVSEKETVNSFR